MASATDIGVFRSRFPEFSTVADADVSTNLNTADVFLDATMWPSQPDFALARMFLGAHFLILQQQEIANATVDGTGLSDLFVRQIRFGERAIGFAQRKVPNAAQDVAPGEDQFDATYYGEYFILLRHRNLMGVSIV
jgi:hypothetical protein